jgi:hypothetical protein
MIRQTPHQLVAHFLANIPRLRHAGCARQDHRYQIPHQATDRIRRRQMMARHDMVHRKRDDILNLPASGISAP